MRKCDLFPLADHYMGDKRFRLPMFGGTIPQRWLRASYTGEFRPPKSGEWYLSGSPIEAYRAPNNLTTAFHIAKIVYIKSETVTIESVLEELPN